MKFRFRDSIQIAMMVHQSPSPRWSNVPNFPPSPFGCPQTRELGDVLGFREIKSLEVAGSRVFLLFGVLITNRVFWCNKRRVVCFWSVSQIMVFWAGEKKARIANPNRLNLKRKEKFLKGGTELIHKSLNFKVSGIFILVAVFRKILIVPWNGMQDASWQFGRGDSDSSSTLAFHIKCSFQTCFMTGSSSNSVL